MLSMINTPMFLLQIFDSRFICKEFASARHFCSLCICISNNIMTTSLKVLQFVVLVCLKSIYEFKYKAYTGAYKHSFYNQLVFLGWGQPYVSQYFDMLISFMFIIFKVRQVKREHEDSLRNSVT